MEQSLSSSETTGMSPELYKAAMIGDIEIIREYKDELERQFTGTKNTMLHVLAQFSDSDECVKEILNFDDNIKSVQSILVWVNTRGETAMHIAARNGRIQIVKALLERSKETIPKKDIESGGDDDTLTLTKQMLRMQTKVGDTALHEAIKYHHNNVGELLFKEDQEFVYPSNDMQETPLYLAAEKGSCDLVDLMCRLATPSYDGPCNMTALHAAIIDNCEGCTGVLLKKLPILTKKADESGWTALHLAARLNCDSIISQLLTADPSMAYITAGQDNGKTALHVATASGKVKAMEEILKHSPDCWEINTCDDRNLLHIAIDRCLYSTYFIIEKPWAAHLCNEKDANGDTPLHLCAISKSKDRIERIIEHAVDLNAYNKENFTFVDMLENSNVYSPSEDRYNLMLAEKGARPSRRRMAATDNKNYKKLKETDGTRTTIDCKKMIESHMIVATLIATVTFAAAFTLPGGYDGSAGPNHGMAVLTRKSAFQAFIISNTIALICSTIAVFLLLFASVTTVENKTLMLLGSVSVLIGCSVISMLIAFIAGSYCVLDSKGLQITICIFGGIASIFLYYFVKRGSTIIGFYRKGYCSYSIQQYELESAV